MLGPHTLSMSHLFRPADPHDGRPLPQWKSWRGLLYVAAAQLLARAARLFRDRRARRLAAYLAAFAALAVQGAMLLTAAYLVDLSISLMELWAELARQHLRITL
jgi:hypothetical protein